MTALPVLAQTAATDAELAAIGLLLGLAAVVLAVSALWVVSLWRVYTKAGQPGWAMLVPVYNTVVLLRIAGRPWWWLLLLAIPFVNLAVWIVVLLDLGRAFGKDSAFGLILLLLPFVGFPILGLGDARYVGPDTRG